ncbi:MAG TPA: adenylate kinase, partial [Planctomycetota bacterium]|nr:adenylate kinase [Planctomycetota bacterium]
PEATVLRRLCGRSVCADCSASYHDEFCRPRVESVCDRCGGALVRRPDDAIEHQRARLRTFLERTEPVLDHYRRQGVLRAVDAARSIEAVARDVHRLVALDRTSR